MEIHNFRIVTGDSIAMGVVNAATPFLPVFVARLGGSPFEVSLLTAIPAMSLFLFAIPIGRFLQTRPRIVPWYSRSRFLANLAYGCMAVAVLMAPSGAVLPVILIIWALAAIPLAVGVVSFPIVMDGAAGPRRYALMSRRWSIMGLTTAIAAAIVGLVLQRLPFPANYQLAFVAFSVAGLVSFWFASQYHLPPADLPDRARLAGLGGRIAATIGTVRSEPAFLRYLGPKLVYVSGARMVLPLIPLYYVRVVEAPDAWIGIIATAHSLALVAGFLLWLHQAARRGGRFVLLTTLLFASLHPLALSLVEELVVVAALAAAAAVFLAGVDLALFDQLMTTIPRRSALTFAAFDTMVVSAVGIVAPFIGATLAVVFELGTALQAGSLVSLVGFLLFALDAARRRPDADTPAARSTASDHPGDMAEPGSANSVASAEWSTSPRPTRTSRL